MNRRAYFWKGVRAELMLLPSMMPFGVLFGALAVNMGLPAWAVSGMSLLVFAGSAQFIALPLIVASAPLAIILLTVLVVNLRHALYGVSLSQYFKPLSSPWKMLLAYLMVDEAYAIFIAHAAQERGPAQAHQQMHWVYLGAGLTAWLSWQLSTLAGALFGASIPPSWGLDFALPLTFIALVVPKITQKADLVAAAAAGVAAVSLFALPLKLGLIAAALFGIAAGFFAAQWPAFRITAEMPVQAAPGKPVEEP